MSEKQSPVLTLFALSALIVISLATCGAWVDDADGLRAAKSSGIVDPRITGKTVALASFAGCAKEDGVAFDVTGKNASGERVEAVVCCGVWFKACTVRYK